MIHAELSEKYQTNLQIQNFNGNLKISNIFRVAELFCSYLSVSPLLLFWLWRVAISIIGIVRKSIRLSCHWTFVYISRYILSICESEIFWNKLLFMISHRILSTGKSENPKMMIDARCNCTLRYLNNHQKWRKFYYVCDL